MVRISADVCSWSIPSISRAITSPTCSRILAHSGIPPVRQRFASRCRSARMVPRAPVTGTSQTFLSVMDRLLFRPEWATDPTIGHPQRHHIGSCQICALWVWIDVTGRVGPHDCITGLQPDQSIRCLWVVYILHSCQRRLPFPRGRRNFRLWRWRHGCSPSWSGCR